MICENSLSKIVKLLKNDIYTIIKFITIVEIVTIITILLLFSILIIKNLCYTNNTMILRLTYFIYNLIFHDK